MENASIWINVAAALTQPAAFAVAWYFIEKRKDKEVEDKKFEHVFKISPAIMVAYNSPTDYQVWDFEVQANGYQTFAPYKDVTELCSENAKAIISEEIVRREVIKRVS